jgi:hypothetical protein
MTFTDIPMTDTDIRKRIVETENAVPRQPLAQAVVKLEAVKKRYIAIQVLGQGNFHTLQIMAGLLVIHDDWIIRSVQPAMTNNSTTTIGFQNQIDLIFGRYRRLSSQRVTNLAVLAVRALTGTQTFEMPLIRQLSGIAQFWYRCQHHGALTAYA